MMRREWERKRFQARRYLIMAALILVVHPACSQRLTSNSSEPIPPNQFSDDVGNWEGGSDRLSDQDTQEIGRFFDQNPDLIGSPDWTGQPKKYVCKDKQSLLRFYWFGGNAERPFWNALELDGEDIRSFSGDGFPGEGIEINN